MNFLKNKTKYGFTLAEVLLTLTIIGIIAAVTIPSLVSDIQEQQLKTAWKKVFADISQATKMVMADNGGSLKVIFTDNNIMRDKYSKYLNVIKTCTNSVDEGCSYSSGKYYNGNAWIPTNTPGFILNNGGQVKFGCASSGCTNTGCTGRSVCGVIVIDVNGFKSPNTVGKDVFLMYVTENSLKPYGSIGDNYETNSQYSCTPTGEGQKCSATYLYQ